jgi:hypothetical protein
MEAVEEVGNERERVAILSGDAIETAIVDAETKGTIFLLDEQNRSAAG